MTDQVAVNTRIPAILKKRVDAFVKQKKEESSKYSLNDCILDGLRLLLEEPDSRPEVQHFSNSLFQTTTTPGFGKDPLKHLRGLSNQDRSPEVSPERAKPWLPIITKLKMKYETDPGAAYEDLMSMLAGEAFPSKYARWHSDNKTMHALAIWLDENIPL